MMAKKINWSLYGAVLSVNLMSLNAGGSYSWTSPVLPKLSSNNSDDNPLGTQITPFEESWIASLLSLGASISPFLSAAVLDKIGRKKTLLLVSIPIIISQVILAHATNINLWYFSRFLLGLGIGCVYSTVPTYVGEIAEDFNRGKMGCFLIITCVAGNVFSFSVGPYISITLFSWVYVIPPVVFLVLFGLFVPESPYFWLMMNKEEEARKSLTKLRIVFDKKELEEMKTNVEKSKETKITFSDLIKSRAIMRGLYISCGLMFFQQMSGICAIISYLQSIFEASGTSLAPEISAIIIGVIQFSANLLAAVLVDKLGRRLLLLVSTTGMIVAHTLLGLYFYLKSSGFDDVIALLSWLPVSGVILYIIAYGFGLSSVPWAMTGELFPPNFRSLASTFTTSVSLFLGFVLIFVFPNITIIIGMASTFWLLAGFCMFGFVFIWMVVPETKGRSLREIQNILEDNKM